MGYWDSRYLRFGSPKQSVQSLRNFLHWSFKMVGQSANFVAIACLVLAGFSLVFVVANPYRLRRVGKSTVSSFIASNRQQQILTLGDAWAGRKRITPFQIKIVRYGGMILAAIAAIALMPLIGQLYALLAGLFIAGLMFYYPNQRFIDGFPKGTIEKLEREAPIFSAFMHRAVGITGLSVQMAFEQWIEVYPNRETTQLIKQVPDGISIPDAILGLGLPASQVPNWIQVIQVLGSISEFGDPESILKEIRDRIRKREEQHLRMMIKRKAFAAPAATVVIMLPGLMCVLIGSILIQALQALGVEGWGF
ncbi:MAG: hypothetical protein AAF633_08725 [Chloroflexota bacterium]